MPTQTDMFTDPRVKQYVMVKPVVDYSVRGLCTSAYPNHPKGCPNHGKSDRCPPAAPRIEDFMDLGQSVYLIWNRYPFGEHVRRMRVKHPEWSQRQLECCLYWQGTARKQLKSHAAAFALDISDKGLDRLRMTGCPEGMGVNMTATAAQAGIALEWPPRRFAHQLALAGYILPETTRKDETP